jgi:hypothetical protein
MEFSLASLFRWKAHPYWYVSVAPFGAEAKRTRVPARLIPVVLVLSMSVRTRKHLSSTPGL